MTVDHTPLRAVVDYEEVIRPLRIQLLSLPKEPFILGNQPFTEIQWLSFLFCYRFLLLVSLLKETRKCYFGRSFKSGNPMLIFDYGYKLALVSNA